MGHPWICGAGFQTSRLPAAGAGEARQASRAVCLSPRLMFVICFWLSWVFAAAWAFLCLQEQGPSPGAVHRCLRLVASLAVEQGFAGTWSSGAVERGLSCFSTRGIFPCQGPNPRPLHRQVGPYPPRHRGSPVSLHLKSGVVGLKEQTRGSWGSGLSPFLLGSAPLGQVVPLLLLFCL